jgi:hypothetical protein
MIKEWDIWIPKNENPDWRPDEQTYAMETGKGHYNGEIFAKIDHTISYAAYGALLKENELLKQHVAELLLAFNGN